MVARVLYFKSGVRELAELNHPRQPDLKICRVAAEGRGRPSHIHLGRRPRCLPRVCLAPITKHARIRAIRAPDFMLYI